MNPATTSLQQLLGHDAVHRSMCKTGMPKASARTGLPAISSVLNDPRTSKAAAMMRHEIGKQCQAETSPHPWRVSGSPRRTNRQNYRRGGRAAGPSAYPSYGSSGYGGAGGASYSYGYDVRGGYSKESIESGGSVERKHASQDLLFPSAATFMKPHVSVSGMSRSNSKSASAPCLTGTGQAARDALHDVSIDTSKPVAKAPQTLLSLVSCERRASVIKRRMSFTRPLLADVMANMSSQPGH